jgi:hypothetical protein
MAGEPGKDAEAIDEPDAGEVVPAPPAAARGAALSERVHGWLPLAIVVVSVLAALMGWRASLADEGATHSDELARQDLALQQELLLQKVQGVDADIRLFGSFEQDSLLGNALFKQAAQVAGAERASFLQEGQGDLEAARQIGSEFTYIGDYTPSDPRNYSASGGSLEPNGSYNPGNPYRVAAALLGAQTSDAGLTSLEPDRLRSHARAERKTGVWLIGLAALFIAGLVFFTFAAVSRNARTLWFAGCGVTVALVALALFPIVELT